MFLSALNDLVTWYEAQCNGDWEHSFGVSIGNIDNPGWALSVDLTGTALENVPFAEYRYNYEDERDWLVCSKNETEKRFTANGGPRMLEPMLRKFLDWADSVASTGTSVSQVDGRGDD